MPKQPRYQTEWDLSPLLRGDKDPEIQRERARIKRATQAFVRKWSRREDWLSRPRVLRRAIEEYEAWLRTYAFGGKTSFYFGLRTSQDQMSAALKASEDQVHEFATKQWNTIQFFELQLSRVAKEKQKAFLKSPLLVPYRTYLTHLFVWGPHLLSEPEERVINLLAGPSRGYWERMRSDLVSREERIAISETGARKKMNLEVLLSLLESRKKKIRDEAARGINDILLKRSDIAEAEMNAIMQTKKVDDELRGFPRADSFRHLSDNIETEIVDAMLKAVSDSFDISARYYHLKARLLGVSQFKYHERVAPYGTSEQTFSYQQALKLVRRVFSSLDEEFVEVFENMARKGTIDVYPRKGKQGGAFCAHHRPQDPTYILLNYTNKLSDVTTLAHEMGHALNYHFTRKRQPALYFGTFLATTEVASTFTEDFVFQELLSEADEATRLTLMLKQLEDDVASIFRQVAAYRFEQELHVRYRKEGYLSKETIGALFQKHMASYMGKSVEQSAGSENWWVNWYHFRVFFYVYSYASGQLISKALQRKVREQPPYIEAVKEFLSAGTSDSPRNIFKRLGIDISQRTFWEEGLSEIERLLTETERLARKLGKL